MLWDAMIVHMALVADCALLYSYRLQDGRRFAGLQIVNPFRDAPAFWPALLGNANPTTEDKS